LSDSEGKRAASGTGKVKTKIIRKRFAKVARPKVAQGKMNRPSEEADYSDEKDDDDSCVVDNISDDDDSGDEVSSSEEDNVVVEDSESESSSLNKLGESLDRLISDIHEGKHEESWGPVSTGTGHKTGAVQPNHVSNEVVQRPTNDASSLRLELAGPMIIRGMSRSQSLQCQHRENHVAERIRTFVKSNLFRRIKFVNSDAMFEQAIRLVMDHERVGDQQRGQFQMLYESVFNEALNTKRSSCEQSGGKIVRESIAKFAKLEEEFFTMDELATLRRAKTDRERKAFFWFFGTFLECVCGKRNWGKKLKYTELISRATEKGGRGKIVTKSDEAFALLIFENYIDKWTNPIAVADKGGTDAAGADKDGTDAAGADGGTDAAGADGGTDAPGANTGEKKKQPRQRGKYTAKKSGHCKYGGWSREGMKRFNELYKLVQEDRLCPQAEAMEKELLAFCKRSQKGAGGKDGGNKQQQDGGNTNAGIEVIEASLVEAAWDLDDE
jgi:hypothetical protein